jgi:hypothetical protein
LLQEVLGGLVKSYLGAEFITPEGGEEWQDSRPTFKVLYDMPELLMDWKWK